MQYSQFIAQMPQPQMFPQMKQYPYPQQMSMPLITQQLQLPTNQNPPRTSQLPVQPIPNQNNKNT